MFGFLRRKKPAPEPAAASQPALTEQGQSPDTTAKGEVPVAGNRDVVAPPVDAPAVDAPPVDAPAVDAPAVDTRADAPGFGEPVVGEPVVGEPVVGEPVVGEPVVGEPGVREPGVGAPARGEAVAGSPVHATPLREPPVPGGRAAAGSLPATPSTQPTPTETLPGGIAAASERAGPPGEPVPVPAPPSRAGWFARLRQGLSRTSNSIASVFVSVNVDEALYEELETALLTSDAGVETTYFVLERLRERVRRSRLADADAVRDALCAILAEMLMPLEQPIDIDRATPLVMMIAGVNGAGKTTSIGKLAHHLRREGKSVLLAAGDTFRAAAREQLAAWGARNDVTVIAQHGGDPAAVAFDAVSAARARGTGVVIVDTAGRLPTQANLMDELRKIRRVIGKAMDGAPHESLLVLDGNTGQNMLSQVAAFDAAVDLTGLVVTKLDGTARGGALLALAHTRRERPIPVYFIGIGEGIDDLQAFSAQEFADALIGTRGAART